MWIKIILMFKYWIGWWIEFCIMNIMFIFLSYVCNGDIKIIN